MYETMTDYTTIRRKVGEYDVVLSDDTEILPNVTGIKTAKFNNLFCVYCEHNGKWCSCLMSKQMLKDEKGMDIFLLNTITHQLSRV